MLVINQKFLPEWLYQLCPDLKILFLPSDPCLKQILGMRLPSIAGPDTIWPQHAFIRAFYQHGDCELRSPNKRPHTYQGFFKETESL